MGFDDLFPELLEYSPGGATDPGGLALPSGGGVYLLTDAEDRFIQLAAAADLKRGLSNRLGGANTPEENATVVSRKRADLREIVRRIRWRRAYSMFEITWQYYRLARVLMPGTYLKQVGFGPCWFVHVDPNAEFPRFQAGKALRGSPGVDLGPFSTQTDAARFIEILEDAFDLCRHYHILQQAPRGQPCAYLDMGKCPAPCDGRIPMSAYRAMLTEALAFACGQREPAFQRWEGAMRRAATERAYERAGAAKQAIDRARRIEHEAFRRVQPIAEFRMLVVQRGAGTTQIKPFFVRGGSIEPGDSVKMKAIESTAEAWIGRLHADEPNGSPADDADRELRSEQMWLVSHFLFKREPPGLYLRAEALGAPAELAKRVRAHFASKRKEELRDIGSGDEVLATQNGSAIEQKPPVFPS